MSDQRWSPQLRASECDTALPDQGSHLQGAVVDEYEEMVKDNFVREKSDPTATAHDLHLKSPRTEPESSQ
jgi:hypothetical protein